MPTIKALRDQFHTNLVRDTLLIHLKKTRKGITIQRPTNADADSKISMTIATALATVLKAPVVKKIPKPQTLGSRFEDHVRIFLRSAFDVLSHVRPGEFRFPIGNAKLISNFDQYSHLQELRDIADNNAQLQAVLGTDYIVEPDVVIAREPETDGTINAKGAVLDPSFPVRSPFRKTANSKSLLHASISAKWSIRSDRAQNSRYEALNLIRNRKGRAPHIVVITGEPVPNRLASIALGTGDIDCVYHFALTELQNIVNGGQWNGSNSDPQRTLATLIEGRRLRDIADMPLDLAF